MPRAPQEPTRTHLLLCNFSIESSVKAVLLLGLRELTESCVLDFVLDSQGDMDGSSPWVDSFSASREGDSQG